MPRRVPLLIACVALAWAAPARAQAPDRADADQARALLDTVATGATADARLAASAALTTLAPRVVDELAAFLARAHASSFAERTAVLKAIKASMPDKSGKFESPGRQKAEQIRADDDFDWLPALLALEPSPAASEVAADIAAIRALTGTQQVAAASAVLKVGFADDTMIYRDECGRRLRQMAPYSLPALVVASQAGQRLGDHKPSGVDKILARYATYQLERLDRQDPAKALGATVGDEDLQVALLAAFGRSEHREAVPTVFAQIDHDAPRIRAAARQAWLAYITPPHPPPAPKRKLVKPGGATSDKEMPLWLNALELARIEVANRTEAIFGTELGDKEDLVAASQRLFDHDDERRAGIDAGIFADGRAKAEAGDLAGAIAVFDRLIAQDPAHAQRGAMAPTYFALAEQLERDGALADAAAMFSKAHGLAPDDARATEALARHYLMLGKAQAADGKDGSAALRRAVELFPALAQDESAARATAHPRPKQTWMLYAAGAVAVGALLLLLIGLRRRA